MEEKSETKKNKPFPVSNHKVCDAEIAEALWKTGGKVTQAARLLNITTETIYEHIRKNSELGIILEESRSSWDEVLLDSSLASILYFVQNPKSMPKHCLEATKYVLGAHTKANRRGWNVKKEEEQAPKEISDKLTQLLLLLKSLQDENKKLKSQLDLNKDESNINSETIS